MILLPWPVACRDYGCKPPCLAPRLLDTEGTTSRPLVPQWFSKRRWCPGPGQGPLRAAAGAGTEAGTLFGAGLDLTGFGPIQNRDQKKKCGAPFGTESVCIRPSATEDGGGWELSVASRLGWCPSLLNVASRLVSLTAVCATLVAGLCHVLASRGPLWIQHLSLPSAGVRWDM